MTRRYDRPFLGKRSCNKLQQHVRETDRFVCTGNLLRKSVSKTEFCRAAKSYTKSLRKSPIEFVGPVCLFLFFFYFKVYKYTKFGEKKRQAEAELVAVCQPTVGWLSTDRRSTEFLGTVLPFYRSSSICAVWDVTGHRKKHYCKLSCNTIEYHKIPKITPGAYIFQRPF